MPSDDVWKKVRERPVPWDDVREQRALNRALEASGKKRRKRPAWIVVGGVAALAIAGAAVLILVLGGPSPPASEEPERVPAEAVEHPTTVSLDGAGRAVLLPGASLALERGMSGPVVVVQSRGAVRYEVDRAARRQVTVRAAGVEIAVVGTVFTVDIEDASVSISVLRGLVRVDDGQREVELGAGEEISVARGRVRGDEGVAALPGASRPEPEEEGEARARTRLPATSVSATAEGRGPGEASSETGPGTEPDVPSDQGRIDADHTDAGPVGGSTASPPETMEELLSAVDAARRRGHLAEASRLLDQIVERFPGDPRSSTALFTMGNVERARGNHAKAARAFRRCWRIDPSGPLAEDARAEAAASWASAGRLDWAAEAARRYLEIYPEGTHAARMRRLVE